MIRFPMERIHLGGQAAEKEDKLLSYVKILAKQWAQHFMQVASKPRNWNRYTAFIQNVTLFPDRHFSVSLKVTLIH